MRNQKRIGIMGALPEEIDYILPLIENKTEVRLGKRTFYCGTIHQQEVVVVFSRIGKVAAAATVSTLILHFAVSEVIFTGVAGGIDSKVKIGDIVIANQLVQHDMNAEPLMPRHEIPLLGKTFFEADQKLLNCSEKAAQKVLNQKIFSEQEIEEFKLHLPTVHVGLIGSGDLFFSTNQKKTQLNQRLSAILCVEMEGAAVAQVCYEFGVPCVVIRSISDDADEHSSVNFMRFIQHIGRAYSKGIVEEIIRARKL
ncbi:5'-methylthioadenosine/adenosylhomocysteine nucleosidase [Vaginella massiliensis]|uniref:5'-methylthioadenosine/adenosylhomocysteine nucleosidase n=1 Tax=Vaginella massiliensis TaxID=1816680 RepID=UPI0037511D43